MRVATVTPDARSTSSNSARSSTSSFARCLQKESARQPAGRGQRRMIISFGEIQKVPVHAADKARLSALQHAQTDSSFSQSAACVARFFVPAMAKSADGRPFAARVRISSVRETSWRCCCRAISSSSSARPASMVISPFSPPFCRVQSQSSRYR